MAKEKLMLVVESRVKEASGELRVAGDFTDALNEKIHEILKTAQERCKANGRSTLRPEDI